MPGFQLMNKPEAACLLIPN